MEEKSSLLRRLPRVDDLMAHAGMAALAEAHRPLAREAAREAIEETRQRLLAGEDAGVVEVEAVAARAMELFRRKSARSLRRAVNATGVVLHTNLGRAPLSASAQEALAEAAAGYCNVQAGLESGERTPREIHVQGLLQRITGAEAALVVNNNAAATVLVLNALASGREVILSRGEMVEIGGSFRIPEILKLAGCRLVEVGCTNRTHLADYEKAITPATALILAVHQSNYRIEGFASQPPVAELVKLARSKGVACVHDLGSGALLDYRRYGLPYEPNVPESLAAGVDAALFSGDKLLGGPQCGIILGKADALQTMRRNPFYRAFRVCKLTLSALEGTLRLFLDAERLPAEHRVTALLAMPLEEIRRRAEELARQIRAACPGWMEVDTLEERSEIGGGSFAGHSLPTVCVRLRSRRIAAAELSQRLRLSDPPIFARVHEQGVLMDPRTILPDEEALILAALRSVGGSIQRDPS